jgi:hypothetical protein
MVLSSLNPRKSVIVKTSNLENANLNNLTNEYKLCNKNWNTVYLVWGVSFINTLIFISIILLLVIVPYLVFGYSSSTWISFVYLIAWISYFYLLHSLTFKRIDSIKKDCFNYGKNIIISKFPKDNKNSEKLEDLI